MLIADINAWIAPLREKRAEIAADRNMVLGVLEYGAQQARTIVEEKMKEVREDWFNFITMDTVKPEENKGKDFSKYWPNYRSYLAL